MDTNVLSLTKSDAVGCPCRSLGQIIPKIHEDQLLSMIKLVITAWEQVPGRTQWSCNSNRVAGKRILRRCANNSIGSLVGQETVEREFGYAPIVAVK